MIPSFEQFERSTELPADMHGPEKPLLLLVSGRERQENFALTAQGNAPNARLLSSKVFHSSGHNFKIGAPCTRCKLRRRRGGILTYWHSWLSFCQICPIE